MPFTLQTVARWVLPKVAPGALFSPWERGTLAAAAEIMLEGSAVSITPAEAAANVEAFLIRGASRRAWRIRVLLAVIELSPLLLLRKPFSRLSRSERERIVRERYIRGGSIWGLCAKVKQLVYLGAYAGPRGEQATGFVPVIERPRHGLLQLNLRRAREN